MNDEAIAKAESEINAVLRKLQRDHGILVDQIEITETDVTTMSDSKRQIIMTVDLYAHKENRSW